MPAPHTLRPDHARFKTFDISFPISEYWHGFKPTDILLGCQKYDTTCVSRDSCRRFSSVAFPQGQSCEQHFRSITAPPRIVSRDHSTHEEGFRPCTHATTTSTRP